MTNDYLKQKILEKATSLEKFGMRDLIWKRVDALNLITTLQNEEIGILGGDVYEFGINQKITPTYDNWSCDPLKGEDKIAYFSRSKQKALNYIQRYPVQPDKQIVFSLVFLDDETIGYCRVWDIFTEVMTEGLHDRD